VYVKAQKLLNLYRRAL